MKPQIVREDGKMYVVLGSAKARVPMTEDGRIMLSSGATPVFRETAIVRFERKTENGPQVPRAIFYKDLGDYLMMKLARKHAPAMVGIPKMNPRTGSQRLSRYVTEILKELYLDETRWEPQTTFELVGQRHTVVLDDVIFEPVKNRFNFEFEIGAKITLAKALESDGRGDFHWTCPGNPGRRFDLAYKSFGRPIYMACQPLTFLKDGDLMPIGRYPVARGLMHLLPIKGDEEPFASVKGMDIRPPMTNAVVVGMNLGLDDAVVISHSLAKRLAAVEDDIRNFSIDELVNHAGKRDRMDDETRVAVAAMVRGITGVEPVMSRTFGVGMYRKLRDRWISERTSLKSYAVEREAWIVARAEEIEAGRDAWVEEREIAAWADPEIPAHQKATAAAVVGDDWLSVKAEKVRQLAARFEFEEGVHSPKAWRAYREWLPKQPEFIKYRKVMNKRLNAAEIVFGSDVKRRAVPTAAGRFVKWIVNCGKTVTPFADSAKIRTDADLAKGTAVQLPDEMMPFVKKSNGEIVRAEIICDMGKSLVKHKSCKMAHLTMALYATGQATGHITIDPKRPFTMKGLIARARKSGWYSDDSLTCEVLDASGEKPLSLRNDEQMKSISFFPAGIIRVGRHSQHAQVQGKVVGDIPERRGRDKRPDSFTAGGRKLGYPGTVLRIAAGEINLLREMRQVPKHAAKELELLRMMLP